jgi:hypothetical protein
VPVPVIVRLAPDFVLMAAPSKALSSTSVMNAGRLNSAGAKVAVKWAETVTSSAPMVQRAREISTMPSLPGVAVTLAKSRP